MSNKTWDSLLIEKSAGMFNYVIPIHPEFRIAVDLLAQITSNMEKHGRLTIETSGRKKHRLAAELRRELEDLRDFTRARHKIQMNWIRGVIPLCEDYGGMDAANTAMGGWQSADNGDYKIAWRMRYRTYPDY